MQLLHDLFSPGAFLPHATCFLARPDVIWLQVVSDAVIALAYFLIPLLLLRLVRKHNQRLRFSWAIWLFAAFIFCCGTTHVMDIVVIWLPLYYLQGVILAVTAIVSMVAALAIIPLIPRLLVLRSPEELETANARLREEIEGREMAERELRHSLAELNRAVAELEQFAYITSHDLQAPLRSIAGFSQLLSRRYRDQLSGDGLEFLDFIDKSARQMQGLIQGLLTLSRIGRAADLKLESRPLSQTVDEALAPLQDDIRRCNAEITIGDLPPVLAEHRLLAQLLQNLVANALKFQPHEPGHRPRVEIGARREGENWHLIVSDNGIGIAPEHLENVFAVFRRLHTAEVYEGTGIGLAICRRIAAFHGGQLWAESAGEGRGARFHLRLPVKPALRTGAMATIPTAPT